MRKSAVGMILLVLAAAQAISHADGGPQAEDNPKNSSKLRAELQAILDNGTHSYQQKICDATHLVRGKCENADWKALWPILQAQGMEIVPCEYAGSAKRRCVRVLVQRDAWLSEGKYAHDLFLEFWIRADGPEKIELASVMLQAVIGLPYDKAIAQKRYPKGTVLDEFISHEEVRAAAQRAPVVRYIRLQYKQTGHRYEGYNSWDYSMHIMLTKDSEHDTPSIDMVGLAVSHLDPLEVGEGRPSPLHPAERRDTFGELEVRAASYSAGFGDGNTK